MIYLKVLVNEQEEIFERKYTRRLDKVMTSVRQEIKGKYSKNNRPEIHFTDIIIR